MKRIAFTLFACFFATLVFSQVSRGGSSGPTAVEREFSSKFPDAEAVRWNTPRVGYSASFFLNGYPMIAFFSEEGRWTSTRISIPEDQIPRPAMQHYRETYSGYRISETVYHDATGNSYYCIFISKGSAERELHYTDKGNFIRVVNR